MNILLDLFLTFARIGLFTFGGGYAMIAIIEDICVEKKRWITQEEMLELTVIAESTPGPIAINAATYVGCRQGGIPGSVCATLGITAPSFVILYLISVWMDNFLQILWIANAFRGIKIAVGLLILDAGLNMAKKAKKIPITWAIIIAACAIMLAAHLFSWKISSISLMLTAAVVSVVIFVIGARKKKGGEC